MWTAARSLALLWLLTSSAWAQDASPERVQHFELASADGQRTYRVQLALPRGPAPRAGFPVLYLLDGNAAFADLTPEQLDAKVVIVAIGYAIDQRFDMDARAYDYTPPGGDEVDTLRGRRNGGADAFLQLIIETIKPEVESRVKIDRKRQTLWGHSYGGLFALYALSTKPAAFQTYVAADPSLWWGQGYITRAELPAKRLFVLTGSGASSAPPPGVDAATIERMQRARASVAPDAARQLVARVKGAKLCELPDVAHGRLLTVSLAPALEVARTARMDCQRLTSITTRP